MNISNLHDRLKKNPDAQCIGDLGVKSSCTYKGLHFIQVGPGIKDTDHSSFIQNQLKNNDHIWSVCSWAMNMNAMQTGDQSNKTGWEVYENCKNAGAIIATAHEHVYSRTKTLIDIDNQIVDHEWSERNKLKIKEGSTFVFVSGVGGKNIRAQERCLPFSYPYGCNGEWASIYTFEQRATYGALFCTFNVGGQPNKAYCYFKNIDGRIIDAFTITSFRGTHLDNTNLTDVDMSSRDLTGDDFSNTVIIDTNLSNTILVGADLSNAVLIGTTLTGADLTDANLTGVILNGNDLTETTLTGADLTDANLTGFDLSGRDLTGTILRGADLSDKDLTGTILRGADLTDAVLPNAYLSGKDFKNTIFNGVDLSGKDLSETDFESASFKNTNLKNANLSGAKFLEVNLTNIKNKSLAGANLFNAAIPYSNLSGVNLDGAFLGSNNFQYTNLSGLDFTVISEKSMIGSTFEGADLSDANFEGIMFNNKNDLGKIKIDNIVLTGAAYLADKSFTELSQILWKLKAFNIWVVGKQVIGNDLALIFITFTDFSNANLQNVNFSNADLTQTVFKNANLTNANLSNAILKGANLSKANLQNVNFSNVDLTQALLRGADLTNANLSNADLVNAILINANLTGAILTGADLENALLNNAILNCVGHPICIG